MFGKVLVAFALIGLAAGRSYIPPSERERLHEDLEEKCKKYGDEIHMDEIEQATYQFIECFFENVDTSILNHLTHETDVSEQRKLFLDTVRSTCTKKSQLTTCIFSHMNASLPCSDLKVRSQMVIAKKSFEEYMSFICDNNAEEVTRLLDDGVFQCLNDKAPGLDLCAKKIKHLGNYRTVSVALACSSFEELETCVVDALKECPKQTTAEFFEYTLQTMKKGSRCNNSNTIVVNGI